MPASFLYGAWETSFKTNSAFIRLNFSSKCVEHWNTMRPSLVVVPFMLPCQENDFIFFYHLSQRNKSQKEEEANC